MTSFRYCLNYKGIPCKIEYPDIDRKKLGDSARVYLARREPAGHLPWHPRLTHVNPFCRVLAHRSILGEAVPEYAKFFQDALISVPYKPHFRGN